MSESAMKSPNELILSAPRALTYAVAMGLSSVFAPTMYIRLSVSSSSSATAAPAGETCLKDVAAASPVAFSRSLTSCQPFNASSRFMYPGLPLSTCIGRWPLTPTDASFWLGLHPYFSFSVSTSLPASGVQYSGILTDLDEEGDPVGPVHGIPGLSGEFVYG